MFNRLKSLFGGNKSEQDAKYKPAAEKLNASTKTQPIQLETHADILETITALQDGALQGEFFKKKAYVDYKDPTHVAYALQLERQKLRGNKDIKHIIPLGDSKVPGDGWQPTQTELADFLNEFECNLDGEDIQRIHLGRHIENLSEPLRLRLVILAEKGWVKDPHGILQKKSVQRDEIADAKLTAKIEDLKKLLADAVMTRKKVPITIRSTMPEWFIRRVHTILTQPQFNGYFVINAGKEQLEKIGRIDENQLPPRHEASVQKVTSHSTTPAVVLEKMTDLTNRVDDINALGSQQLIDQYDSMITGFHRMLEDSKVTTRKNVENVLAERGYDVRSPVIQATIDQAFNQIPALPEMPAFQSFLSLNQPA
ncbi:MAG: hypothetical protein KBD00_01235 [Candidatus Peribacteraceae bacterium]|nr:hypothetical protein [Candidatus Peribacteraceae bacterium]